jgi:hypothetical protein
MGGVTLPTANTPGFGTITRNDRTYVGCDCVIAFLKAAEQLGLAMGLIKEGLDIVQLTGNAAASGGVHRLGAAFDVKQFSPPWVIIFREMGSAYWPRLDPNPGIPGDLWDGNEHGHGGIDCAHNSLIAYQNVAYRRGYNGLGQGWYNGQYLWGYGAKDNTFRPKVQRPWREGITWAQAQTALLKKKEEDIMATIDELDALLDKKFAALRVKDANDRVLGALPAGAALGRLVDGGKPRLADNGDVGVAVSLLRGIAEKVGAPVDVDEKVLAAAVLEGLKPAISSALSAAISAAPGASADQVADAVVARLGAALAS